jgi:hypothetical protein
MITNKNKKAKTNKNKNSETYSAGLEAVTPCNMVEGYTDVSEERTVSISVVEN